MSKILSFEQLITDDSFIRYCLQKDRHDEALWNQYLEKFPQQREIVNSATREVIQLYDALVYQDQQKILSEIKQKITRNNAAIPAMTKPVSKHLAWRAWASIAATILLVSVAYIFYQKPWQPSPAEDGKNQLIYLSEPGEHKNITLSDGTKVTLNVASNIQVAEDFGQKERVIILDGEAFFEVAHNPEKAFIVHTKAMDIKVLGTVFNVKAYHEDIEAQTSLIEGKIEVTLKNEQNKKITLLPSDKIIVPQRTDTSSELSPVKIAAKNHQIAKVVPTAEQQVVEISWLNNHLSFRQEKLSNVAQVLERWYGITFVFEDNTVKQLVYSASFKNTEKIDEILETLKSATPFNYRKDGNVIYISNIK